MKKTSKAINHSGNSTLVFLGSGPVAAESLKSLLNHFPIEAVITKAAQPHHNEVAPVESVAKSKALKTHFANTKTELDKLIKTQRLTSRLGVIVDYGVIVSSDSIRLFELGIVNSHFSLLPQWRGADPITFSILSGQTKTGVSLMLIDETLDTGKLLTQKSLQISNQDTTPFLTQRLIKLSNRLLAEYLPLYLSGKLKLRAQSHPDRATYSRKLTKEDGLIDWSKSADQIEREIRAYIEWPKSRTKIAGKEVIITEADALSFNRQRTSPGKIEIVKAPDSIIVECGSDYLRINRLKPAGKNEMSADAFIRGYIK